MSVAGSAGAGLSDSSGAELSDSSGAGLSGLEDAGLSGSTGGPLQPWVGAPALTVPASRGGSETFRDFPGGQRRPGRWRHHGVGAVLVEAVSVVVGEDTVHA